MSVKAYVIETDDAVKLRAICCRLLGGSDKMRDQGHQLMLILDRVETNELPDEMYDRLV